MKVYFRTLLSGSVFIASDVQKMSVFKTSNDTPLEKRVKILEKKVSQLEALLGKKPTKATATKSADKEEDEMCVIT